MAVDRGAARTSSRLQLQPAPNLVVKPADDYDEETRFPRSSLWGKRELDMLGVRVQQTPLLDLTKIIGNVKPWSSEVQNSIFRFHVLSNKYSPRFGLGGAQLSRYFHFRCSLRRTRKNYKLLARSSLPFFLQRPPCCNTIERKGGRQSAYRRIA